MHNSQKNS